ncbi:DUF2516 family protein [Corynebacterium sp. MSK297]|uniref:DUF2516 family protein n=1 Tax=Corynebacterium sp. MSK297 TaxID=3050221 RepID=UPI003312FF5E
MIVDVLSQASLAAEHTHHVAQLPPSGPTLEPWQQNLFSGVFWLQQGLYSLVAIAGLVGAISAAMTRDDAFDADSRQSKMVWVAMLAGSAFIVPMPIPILPWVGMVVIGIYWFDVRPSLKALINGEYRWD